MACRWGIGFGKENIQFLFLVAFLAAVLIVTAGLLASAVPDTSHFSQSLPSKGRLIVLNTAMGVYLDSACTQNATTLDWGALAAGESSSKTLWIKNLGTTSFVLSLSTGGWSPSSAGTWISLVWNQEGTVLDPNHVVEATLTLAASASIGSNITDFAFNTVLAAAP
jgi:hypothetical protein